QTIRALSEPVKVMTSKHTLEYPGGIAGYHEPGQEIKADAKTRREFLDAFAKEIQEFDALSADIRSPEPRDFQIGDIAVDILKSEMKTLKSFNRTPLTDFVIRSLHWQSNIDQNCLEKSAPHCTDEYIARVFNELLNRKDLCLHATPW